jgi:hypothetical protein
VTSMDYNPRRSLRYSSPISDCSSLVESDLAIANRGAGEAAGGLWRIPSRPRLSAPNESYHGLEALQFGCYARIRKTFSANGMGFSTSWSGTRFEAYWKSANSCCS